MCQNCKDLSISLYDFCLSCSAVDITQIIVQCRITPPPADFESDKMKKRIEHLGAKIKKRYNGSIFIHFEHIGTIQLTRKGYVKVFVNKMLKNGAIDIFPSLSRFGREICSLKSAICHLKCVNFNLKFDTKSVLPWIVQFLVGESLTKPYTKSRESEIGLFVPTKLEPPYKGQWLFRFENLTLSIDFSNGVGNLISRSFKKLQSLESKISKKLKSAEPLTADVVKSLVSETHNDNGESNRWSLSEKFQFLSVFEKLVPVFKNVQDSGVNEWDFVTKELEDFLLSQQPEMGSSHVDKTTQTTFGHLTKQEKNEIKRHHKTFINFILKSLTMLDGIHRATAPVYEYLVSGSYMPPNQDMVGLIETLKKNSPKQRKFKLPEMDDNSLSSE